MVTIQRKTYPYTVQYYQDGEISQDDNGDMVVEAGEWSEEIPCDAIPSSDKAAESVFDDGKAVAYSWMLVLRRGSHTFSFGEKVKLNRLNVTTTHTVKGYMEYMFRVLVMIY